MSGVSNVHDGAAGNASLRCAQTCYSHADKGKPEQLHAEWNHPGLFTPEQSTVWLIVLIAHSATSGRSATRSGSASLDAVAVVARGRASVEGVGALSHAGLELCGHRIAFVLAFIQAGFANRAGLVAVLFFARLGAIVFQDAVVVTLGDIEFHIARSNTG